MKKVKKAIALKYQAGIDAPVIVAKGEGKQAEIILAEAEKNEIPIKEDVVLVDLLGLSNAGDLVPESAWKALAQIFSFILEDNEQKNNWKQG